MPLLRRDSFWNTVKNLENIKKEVQEWKAAEIMATSVDRREQNLKNDLSQNMTWSTLT